MVNSYTNTPQTIAANDLLSFSVNDILTGCTVLHSSGSTSFKLNRPGFYYVSFTGVGAITGATAGAITVNLLRNGTVVPGATSTQESASATGTRTVNFSKIIQVLPSCCAVNNTTTLAFQNAGLETTFSNVNVVITKLAQGGSNEKV